MPSERTPLYQQQVPPYVFATRYNRAYKSKVRRFQCCMCAGLLAIFITALVITVSMSVNEMEKEMLNDSSTASPILSSPATDVEPLQTLLTMTWPIQDRKDLYWDTPPSEAEIKEAIEVGKKELQAKETLEEFVPPLQLNTPSYRHQMATRTHPRARELSRAGFIMEGATRHLARMRSRKHKGRSHEIHVEWLPKEVCSETAENNCPTSAYRTADGSCNNLQHPRTWGVAMRPFRRILPPDYADGIAAPRKAGDGSNLPPSREISLTINRPFYRDDPNFTVMLAVWGQFIDHDITATAISQGTGGRAISCCVSYYQAEIQPHPECYTVFINSPDPYFNDYNVTCMEFVRSSPAPVCSFGPREQLNQASSFLDGSVVYGTSDSLMTQLRTLEGGELKMLKTPDGRELLPISTDANDGCNQEEQLKNGRYCFLSGDPRSNENIHLTTMHLLFARQHNYIARKLTSLNPTWDDEKLFQESRKIVAAQIQHITYNEFLPVILGPHMMRRLKMIPRKNGTHSKVYDPNLDPSIANSFASSAFRFGHTLLPGLVRMIKGDNSSDEYREMHSMLFNPFELYDKDFLEKTVRGAINTPVEKVDTYFNSEFSNHLFERKPSVGRPKGLCGLDLVSLNIQRGRDHGLPGYPAFREHCGLSRPQTFEDMAHYMDSESHGRIKRLYKTPDDVDMYTGALAEIPLRGSLVGPTVTCLLTDQFLRIQRGDRYWYETSEEPQAFTTAQLKTIQETTLAKIICETSGVASSQPFVMKGRAKDNMPTECKNLPDLNLDAWKEEDSRATITTDDRPGKIWLIKSSLPKKPTSMKLSGNVTSGTLSIEGTEVWSGVTPAQFPTKPIESVFTRSPLAAYPPAFAQGVVWQGNVTVTGTTASIVGQFSLPQYPSFPTDAIQQTWYNGQFSVNIALNLNPFNENISVVQSFTSPIFMHGDKTPPVVNSEVVPTLPVGSTVANIIPSASDKIAPIILIGTFTADKTEFFWSGKIVVRLPDLTTAVPAQSDEPLLQMAYTPKTYIDHVKMGGETTSGSLTVMGSSIWNGDLPLAIPVDPLDVDTSGDGTIFYGRGVNWKGTSVSVFEKTAELRASFSLPRYVRGDGLAPFSIQWLNGELSLNYNLRWWGNCNDTLSFDGDFTTYVHLADRRQYTYLRNSTKATLQVPDLGYAGSPKSLEGMRSDIILLGRYSPDGEYFYWSGNFTLIMPKVLPIPEVTPTTSLKATPVTAPSKVRAPLRLVGGQVNVGGWNVWYNDIPIAIPVHLFDAVARSDNDIEDPSTRPIVFGHGILWNGTGTAIDKNYIKISGTFSSPKFIHSSTSGNFSLQWLNGNFDLQFQSNQTLEFSGSFSTSLYFSEKPFFETLRDGPMNRVEDLKGLGIKATDIPKNFEGDPEKLPRAPLIMLGAFSRDKTEFLWSGECILVLPSTTGASPEPGFTLLKASKPSSSASQVKFGGFASGANITIGGVELTGLKPPLVLPTAVLDSILSMRLSANEPVSFAQGILWKAKLTEGTKAVTINGSYSFPSSNNGTLSWYNGEFSLAVNVLWKTTNLSADGSFSSPLYLKDNSVGKINASNVPNSGPFISTDIPLLDPDVSGSAPIILGGQYTPDHSSFLWTGEVTVILPKTPEVVLLAEAPEEKVEKFSVYAYANGGSVTVSGTTIWIGNRVPLSIPLHPFEQILLPSSETGKRSHSDGYGIPWQGFISSSSPDTVKVWGSYSLPKTNSNSSIEWYNGDFAFDMKLMSTLPGNIDLEGSYFSIVRLRESEGYLGLEPEWSLATSESVLPSPSPSVPSLGNSQFVPFILHGVYSTDRKSFIWSGNVTIVVGQ